MLTSPPPSSSREQTIFTINHNLYTVIITATSPPLPTSLIPTTDYNPSIAIITSNVTTHSDITTTKTSSPSPRFKYPQPPPPPPHSPPSSRFSTPNHYHLHHTHHPHLYHPSPRFSTPNHHHLHHTHHPHLHHPHPASVPPTTTLTTLTLAPLQVPPTTTTSTTLTSRKPFQHRHRCIDLPPPPHVPVPRDNTAVAALFHGPLTDGN
ncbi:uncharacterized protein [Penaeus vannamei]|uniref:uncharacterized protein n=1 Tax=Penaeus vannamei TaxID=6689 RepID=UPI00387F68CA